MQQVYFTGGQLYSAITSTIFDGKNFVDGVEWFTVTPTFKKGALKEELEAVINEITQMLDKNRRQQTVTG